MSQDFNSKNFDMAYDEALAAGLRLACHLSGARYGRAFVKTNGSVRELRYGTLFGAGDLDNDSSFGGERAFAAFAHLEGPVAMGADQIQNIHGEWAWGLFGVSVAIRVADRECLAILHLFREEPWAEKSQLMGPVKQIAKFLASSSLVTGSRQGADEIKSVTRTDLGVQREGEVER